MGKEEGGVVSRAKHAEQNAAQRRFKPYAAYKDSGVEWLGKIPAHWEGSAAVTGKIDVREADAAAEARAAG